MNGIIQVTLEAIRLYSDPPGVKRSGSWWRICG